MGQQDHHRVNGIYPNGGSFLLLGNAIIYTHMKTAEEKVMIKGIHTFRTYDMTSVEAQTLEKEILHHIETKNLWDISGYQARYNQLIESLKRFMTKEMVINNLVTTVGRSVLAQRLAGTTTYTGIINYGALGSSATAVANGDTQLGTEVFRKTVASASYTTNVAFIDFFYTKADTNGTYQEFGTFIDGTGSANSGQIFTHALTGGWVKTSSESMTVSCQYTIT